MLLMILMIVSPEQWTSHFLLHHERCKWGWKGSCSEEREPFDQKTKDKKNERQKNVKRSSLHLFHRTNHIAHRAFNLHWLKKEKTLINSELLHPWFQRCKNLLNSVFFLLISNFVKAGSKGQKSVEKLWPVRSRAEHFSNSFFYILF